MNNPDLTRAERKGVEGDGVGGGGEMNENDYTEGSRAAYRSMLGECLRGLGDEGKTLTAIAEIYDARQGLKEIWKLVGLDDWSDDLHLGDVVSQILKQIQEDYGDATD